MPSRRKFVPAIPIFCSFRISNGVLLGEVGQALAGWNVRVSGQYIVASLHPLPEIETRNISYAGSNHHCLRYTLLGGAQPVTVYNVHLLSPRSGLLSVRHHEIDGMEGNVGERMQEAILLSAYLRAEPGPTILTGDLNAPVQSLVCRRLFDAGLRDAFSEAGRGYGYSYGQYTRVGTPYVRIDHILVSRQWQVQRCWVGNSQGSDHSPVIADLVLP